MQPRHCVAREGIDGSRPKLVGKLVVWGNNSKERDLGKTDDRVVTPTLDCVVDSALLTQDWHERVSSEEMK